MRRRSTAGAVALALLAGLAQPGLASPGGARACGTWQPVPVEDPTAHDVLYSVSGTSGTDDVWAVGDGSPTGTRTLTEHWGGQAWGVVGSKRPGSWSSLGSVGSLSRDDVWAVGEYLTQGGGFDPLAEHWDGRGWTLVPIPSSGAEDTWLNGLAFSGPHDGWAVGSFTWPDDYTQTLTMRWDGAAWTIVPSPNADFINTFKAVDALSSTDAWAVGFTRDMDAIVFHPFAEHWDGAAWTITDVPEPAEGASWLEGVAAVSADDVWAVGIAGRIWHWDGSAWSMVGDPSSRFDQLTDVAAAAADDVWAVGSTISPNGHIVPLVEHWDGGAWTVARTPRINGTLFGVETFAGGNVWAVGSSGGKALSLHLQEC
jgi:hypothetical protein